MDELLVLFKAAQDSRRPWPHHQSFRRASLRSPSSKTGAAKGIPVLLTTVLLLFCSPRDSFFHFGKDNEVDVVLIISSRDGQGWRTILPVHWLTIFDGFKMVYCRNSNNIDK